MMSKEKSWRALLIAVVLVFPGWPAQRACAQGVAKPSASGSEEAGLASLYPGDVGIAKDPAVILVCDYDDPDTWKEGWQGNLVDLYSHTTEPSRVFRGHGAVWMMQKRGTPGGAAHFNLASGETQLYHRWYAKFPEGIHTDNDTMKQAGFGGVGPGKPDWWALGNAGQRVDGKDRLFAIMCPTAAGQTGVYFYHPDQKGPWGDWITFGPKLDYKQWNCYEFMLKLNDPAEKNGEMKFWINGQLVKTIGGLRFRTWDKLLINQILDEAYNQVMEDYSVCVDNRVVARRYIGPVAEKPVTPQEP